MIAFKAKMSLIALCEKSVKSASQIVCDTGSPALLPWIRRGAYAGSELWAGPAAAVGVEHHPGALGPGGRGGGAV